MPELILLSFVIPVYNVEKYLNECLDSIFAQSINEYDYEVIAVNDGSTDRSPEILKSYSHHKNLKIITQQNGGQGTARNIGLKAARGKYIHFVDSDDYLLPGAAQTLLGFARDFDCDIIEFAFEVGNDAYESAGKIEQKRGRVPTSGEGKNVFAEWVGQNAFLNAPWLRIYKNEFLNVNSLYFLPMVYEDAEWQPRCFFYAKKVIYIPVSLYSYRQWAGSTVATSVGAKQYWSYIKLVAALNEFRKGIEKNAQNSDFLTALGAMMANRLEWLINNIYRYIPKNESAAMFAEIEQLRDVLGLATNKKGKLMYKFTRFLPAGLAFRMYKIF